MKSAKESMAEIIQSLPDDSTYDEILRELAFERMVRRGLDDSRNDRVISNEDMKCRIESINL